MTTANLFNVSAGKNGYTPSVDVSKKLQEEAKEVSEIFASMMNQSLGSIVPSANDYSAEGKRFATDGVETAADSYERYSYRDNQIDSAGIKEMTPEELEQVDETLSQTEEEIQDTICEAYDISEEDFQKLLEDMGLSVLDLLNPKNLVQFLMTLTGVASGEELLLDENFLKVMETMDSLSNNLMKELQVDEAGLQDLITLMDRDTQTSFGEELQNRLENEQLQGSDEATVAEPVEGEAMDDAENVSDEMTEDEAEGLKVQVEEQEESAKTAQEDKMASDTGDQEAFSGNRNTDSDSLMNHDNSHNQTFMAGQSTTNVGHTGQMQMSSYMSMDTVQIMEQIAEQIKVVITPENTSMEMQLNPENLGKIYLNITAEEGVVNAHFVATDDIVKETLEAQVATLRENLNQAGVKVDAIEVTIASHEFERNLEQNQQNPQEEQVLDEKNSKRRNITVDTLDELAGVMTEEETLVAQMMKDNGNTVDYTA